MSSFAHNPNARILLADEDEITRAFLAENVVRHIFGVLCPGWLCARLGEAVLGLGRWRCRLVQAGHITVRATRAS